VIEPDAVLHADLPGSNYKSIGHLIKSFRPEIAIVHGISITLCELTICCENNTHKSRDYKHTKYINISEDRNNPFTEHSVKLFTWEHTSLGFIPAAKD